MKYKKIVIVILILCVLAGVSLQSQKIIQNGAIKRNAPGKGQKEEEITAYMEGKKYDMKVTINEQKLSEKQAKNLLKQAEKEIEKTFLGKNKSLEHISKSVVMKNSYQKGLVDASWYIKRSDLIDTNGKIIGKSVPKEGTPVNAEVYLSYEDYEEVYRFSFMLYPLKQTSKEKIMSALQKSEQETKTQKELTLPTTIGKQKIQWKEKNSHEVLIILFLGIIVIPLSKIVQKEKEQKKKKNREKELLLSYPQMISNFSILLGAGMTVTKAWEKIVVRYQKSNLKQNALYEEMNLTLHEIQDGIGERKAYENFGKRCNLASYKKMSSIIIQNLKKGSQSVASLLEKEAKTANWQRKNQAKRKGEEASTKMLLPMMLMLGIIMIIVLVPALSTL